MMVGIARVLYDQFYNEIEAVNEFVQNKIELVSDGVPGSPEHLVAGKLRRGLVITTFNSLENLIKDITRNLIISINELNISHKNVSPETMQKIDKLLVESMTSGIRRIEPSKRSPLYLTSANLIVEKQRNRVVKLSERGFHVRSNVERDSINEFFSLVAKIIKEYSKLGGKGITSYQDFSSWSECGTLISSSLGDLPGPIEKKSSRISLDDFFQYFSDERNKAAHSSKAPDLNVLRDIISGALIFGFSISVYAEISNSVLRLIDEVSSSYGSIKSLKTGFRVSSSKHPKYSCILNLSGKLFQNEYSDDDLIKVYM